ncbi:MAG: aldehyde dehydrogenase family protein [Clostridiales Family XIII bacterium]|jgi:succinate-semialdehyde dehydrogenase|nr:aldehyde dehydrogenase family protein [Clostridiales Family XIII bacterium]
MQNELINYVRIEERKDRKMTVEEYIKNAKIAQQAFEKFSQEKIDQAVKIIAKSVFDNAECLAKIAVEETGMGNIPDKITKNKNKAKMIFESLKNKKTMGIIEKNEDEGITKIAKPIGVVLGITPMTNPTVTPMSNAMFALKCGNAIIVSPHHGAINSSRKTVELINTNLAKKGFPDNLIQIVKEHSRDQTRTLMSSVDIVIATGGMGMVKAAYSSGKPALGVGAGNVQCIIDENYNLKIAAKKIVAGRSFDNGIICSAEQSIIISEKDYDVLLAELGNAGALVLTDENEISKIRDVVFVDGKLNRQLIGQPAEAILEMARLTKKDRTKIIAVPAMGTGKKDVLSGEKMCPVISIYKYKNFKEAIYIARENLETAGKGHSVCIHSDNKDNIEYAATNLSVSRFVINQISASSAGGSFNNGLAPTNTLGCGSWGNNSISENLTYKHLMNVSRIAYYLPDKKVPSDDEIWN